jgi:Icc-related predicted phosphoesterase
MTRVSLLAFVTLLALAALGACTKPADTPKKQPDGPAQPDTTKPAAPVMSSPECVGPVATSPEETFEIAGKKYVRKGSTISQEGADADDELIVGQVSDIKDHTPDNAANLKLVLEWMKGQKVDIVAVTGDLGESQDSIEKVLKDAAALGVPVLTIIGNRECREHFTKAVEAVQKDHKNVINMNAVRVFNTDDASFVSMPGYYNKSYIHCAEGCEYTTDDIKQLPTIAQAATAPVKILVSHGPPLQSGDKAIDRIHEGANVGDPALAELLKANAGLFPFGMFGNIQEAGGYATDLAGTTRVAADTFADSFYLNPGPLDSVRWVMLDGSESVGMAAMIKVKGKQASYSIHRLKPGEAKPVGDAPPAPAPGAPAPAPTK